jgi:hypothetical protein
MWQYGRWGKNDKTLEQLFRERVSRAMASGTLSPDEMYTVEEYMSLCTTTLLMNELSWIAYVIPPTLEKGRFKRNVESIKNNPHIHERKDIYAYNLEVYRYNSLMIVDSLQYYTWVPSGVYLLYQEEEIVYVGKSKKFRDRLLTHLTSNKPFDGIGLIPCNLSDMSVYEAYLITTLKPKLNKESVYDDPTTIKIEVPAPIRIKMEPEVLW